MIYISLQFIIKSSVTIYLCKKHLRFETVRTNVKIHMSNIICIPRMEARTTKKSHVYFLHNNLRVLNKPTLNIGR